MALFDDVVPVHSISDQFKNTTHQKPRAAKREFSVANLRIRDDVSPDALGFHVKMSLKQKNSAGGGPAWFARRARPFHSIAGQFA